MPVSGVIMTSDRRGVFCRRLMSAACSLNCEYFDLLSAAVARNRMPSAPRLAPRVYLHVGSEVDGERARARQLGLSHEEWMRLSEADLKARKEQQEKKQKGTK